MHSDIIVYDVKEYITMKCFTLMLQRKPIASY